MFCQLLRGSGFIVAGAGAFTLLLALAPERAPGAVQALSPREVDAMTLLAVGYSRAQVADRLSISELSLIRL